MIALPHMLHRSGVRLYFYSLWSAGSPDCVLRKAEAP